MGTQEILHVLKYWEKKYGFIRWSKGEEEKYPDFFPKGKFTLIAFGKEYPDRTRLLNYTRMYVGKKVFTDVEPGSTLKVEKLADDKYLLSLTTFRVRKIPANLHEDAVSKWVQEEKSKFGAFFQPEVQTNADINQILPKTAWLTENKKYVDGLARMKIGGQPIYQSVLEVQHKGVREDLVVRVKIILPFVTRVDIVAAQEDIVKIRELLERIADPNVLKTRVKFYSFQKYVQ